LRINRRRFLSLGTLVGLGSAIPFQSCFLNERPKPLAQRNPQLLSPLEWDTLLAVQEVLFPHEKEAPGAIDVNAAGYFQWVLSDSMLDPREIKFKKNGLTWLEEESQELFSESFLELNEKRKEETLQSIAQHSWGRSWISTMLLLIFEALLSDPIYGANSDEKGWKWLDYTAGIPRPAAGKTYLDYTLSDGTKISPSNA
jgi:hypothetical protein